VADARFCKHCGEAVEPDEADEASEPGGDCASCGEPLEEGAKFCKKCGAAIAGASATEDRTAAAGSRERSRPKPRATGDGPARPRPAGGKNRPMLTLAIVVAVVAGVVVAVFAYMDNANKTTPPAGGVAPGDMGGMGGEMGGGMAAPAGPPFLGGTIEVAEAAKSHAPTGGVYYIMARASASGPPLAVVKLPASTATTTFSIGPADMMMGGALQEPVIIQVRWDQDGDAMTRQAGDLVGELTTPVNPGTMDLKIEVNGKLDEDVTVGGGAMPEGSPESAPAMDGDPSAEPSEAPASAPAEPTEAPAPAPAGGDIVGTVQFAPDVVPTSPESGIVFLYARQPEVQRGPPLAAVRLAGSKGPVAFLLGDKDAMMGGTLGAAVNLEARWDQDGNAMTKQPGDIEGTYTNNPARPGQKDVIILLDTVRTN